MWPDEPRPPANPAGLVLQTPLQLSRLPFRRRGPKTPGVLLEIRWGEVSRRTFSGAFSTAFWSPDCLHATASILVKDFGLRPILEVIH